jgi:hypothetical protein
MSDRVGASSTAIPRVDAEGIRISGDVGGTDAVNQISLMMR